MKEPMLMTTQDLLDKTTHLPERPIDVPTVPPIELVGFVVRWNRGLRQCKTTTLADFARVSVSTVESRPWSASDGPGKTPDGSRAPAKAKLIFF
jgi:hypothetical protein